jgi:hypothetical protein
VFHKKKKERSARRKQIRRAAEELAKERREREAVDKGDRKGRQWKRRKKGALGIAGYINADGTKDIDGVGVCGERGLECDEQLNDSARYMQQQANN